MPSSSRKASALSFELKKLSEMNVWIVRHGLTEENLGRLLQGHLPGRLTEEGRAQVAAAAERLNAMAAGARCIVSSDLRRAAESAAIIARRLALPVVTLEVLRERDWGIYTGMPLAEARERYWRHGKWKFDDPSAETEARIAQRATRALAMLRMMFAPADTIIVVTHGQFARNMIAARFNCSCREVASLVNAEVRRITL